jgi:hypothetical protein
MPAERGEDDPAGSADREQGNLLPAAESDDHGLDDEPGQGTNPMRNAARAA